MDPTPIKKLYPVRPLYVRMMDVLYYLCVGIAIFSVVFMTVMIFSGVVMRYIFLFGAHYAEPLSIFFAVQLTMYGAAACLRANAHLRLTVFVTMLPEKLRPWPTHFVQMLLAGMGIFMVYYGQNLVRTTWFQYYPEFSYVKVGLVYSAIPISGFITLLFVIEAWIYPNPLADQQAEEDRRSDAFADEEARRLSL